MGTGLGALPLGMSATERGEFDLFSTACSQAGGSKSDPAAKAEVCMKPRRLNVSFTTFMRENIRKRLQNYIKIFG
jgi:hypothetical protein